MVGRGSAAGTNETSRMLQSNIRERITEHIEASTRPRCRTVSRAASEILGKQVASGTLGSSRAQFAYADIAEHELAVRAELVWQAITQAFESMQGELSDSTQQDLHREALIHVDEQALAVARCIRSVCNSRGSAFDQQLQQYAEEQAAQLAVKAKYFVDQLRRPKTDGSHLTQNFHAPVGAVQLGAHATAHVSLEGPTSARVVQALEGLLAALGKSTEISAEHHEQSAELVTDLIAALKAEKPSPPKVKGLLGGLAMSVQTVASVRGAWQAVKDASALIGLHLP